MPPKFFPLRWESTGDQWWFASPIDWAAANGHYDLVRELLHLDTNLLIKLTSLRRIRRLESVWDDEEQFHDVAKCRAQVASKLLLECETKEGHNTLIRAGYGGWLLYTAASAGDVDFVKHLLEKDPLLVFGEGEYGITDVFYAAARSKNSDIFRLLLDSSLSPGCYGSKRGELEREEEMDSSEFRWEIRNRAVHASARGGNVEFLGELIGDCSDVLTYRDAQGSTMLHTASGRGQTEVIKYLVASYDIIDSLDNQGNTALHVAAYRGHLAVVEILVSASPALALLTNNYGDTFLHMAVSGFWSPGFRRLDLQIKLIKQLLCGKIINLQEIINIRNNDGRTALHMAVTENIQSDLVELLMTAPSINFNIKDAYGHTPLDLLKQQPRTASSQILIKQIISAGGISNCKDHMTRKALVSHLKMHCTGGSSPGTSFRIPDAEIFLHTGFGNASDGSSDSANTDYTSSSAQLSRCGSRASYNNSSDNRKPRSVNKGVSGLKLLLQWPRRKEIKAVMASSSDNISVGSFDISSKLERNPIPLRQRFSSVSSLPNNKRLSVYTNLPSPSTKKKFAAGLMHGVIHLMPRSDFGSPSSPFSESSWSSLMSPNKGKPVVMALGNVSAVTSS